MLPCGATSQQQTNNTKHTAYRYSQHHQLEESRNPVCCCIVVSDAPLELVGTASPEWRQDTGAAGSDVAQPYGLLELLLFAIKKDDVRVRAGRKRAVRSKQTYHPRPTYPTSPPLPNPVSFKFKQTWCTTMAREM